MDEMSKELCGAKMQSHDERFSRDKERLDEQKERLDEHDGRIKSVEEALIVLTGIQKRMEEDEREQKEKLTAIEKRPGVLWDKLISAAIAAVISAAIAWFMPR